MPRNEALIAPTTKALIQALEQAGLLASRLGELLEAPEFQEVSVELYNFATEVREHLGEAVSHGG